MSSTTQQLSDDALIALLEKERCTFTDRYYALLSSQETALQKASVLIAEPLETLKRNHSKKKANFIMNDIKNCISNDVFVLCALVANPSTLGVSKLSADFVANIRDWWESVHHPKGLTVATEKYMMKISPNEGLKSDELPESQPSRYTTAQNSSSQRADILGPEPSAALQSPALLPQQDSIITPTAQPLQLDGLQDDPETSHNHGRILISNMMNPAPPEPRKRTRSQDPDERSSKRPRLGPQQIPGNLVLPGECQYWSFSFTSRDMIENLPEPFRTGMKTSNLWRMENESGGPPVTNCLSLYLPETFSEDAFLVARIGCLDGYRICNLFGLQDPEIPVSEEGAAQDATE